MAINIAAISPEQARTNKLMGLGGGGMAAGAGFDPATDDPGNPDNILRQLKPIGHYQGWGGLQSIGEGLHNRAVWNMHSTARERQRESERTAGSNLSSFVSGGGMAAGPEALAPILQHPSTRALGMQIFDQHQRQEAQRNDPLRQAQIEYYRSRADLNSAKAGGGMASGPDETTRFFNKLHAAGYQPQYGSPEDDATPDGATVEVKSDTGEIPEAIVGGQLPQPEDPARVVTRQKLSVDPDILTDQERALGVTPDEKAKKLRLRYLTDGAKPKIGYVWDLDKDGKPMQRLIKEPETRKQDVTPATVKLAIGKIDDSMTALGGDVDPKTGAARGNGPWRLTKGLSEMTGGFVRPDLYQALQSGHYGAMQALYAQSGKSFSKAEMENDLQLFKPRWQDTDEMSLAKLKGVRDLLSSLEAAKNLPEERRAMIYRSALARAVGNMPNSKAVTKEPAVAPRGPAAPAIPGGMAAPATPGATPGAPAAPQGAAPAGRKQYDPKTGNFIEVR